MREKEGRKSETERGRAREFFVPSLLSSPPPAPPVLLRGPKVGRSPQGLRRESVEGERGIRQLYPRGFLEQGRARSQRVREGRGAEMLSVGRPTASASPGFHRGRGGETLIILRGRERLAERRRRGLLSQSVAEPQTERSTTTQPTQHLHS